jgi:hypothetical protein
MVTGGDVLFMLRPEGGWIINGNDYDTIQWISCDPVSQEQFDAGFIEYPIWKAAQDAQQAAAKAQAEAKLEALGLTTQDLEALGL